MPNNSPGTAELIARELASALKPLESKFATENIRISLATLGLRLPDTLNDHPDLLSAISDIVTRVSPVPTLITDLITAIENESLPGVIGSVRDIGELIGHVIQDIETIATELDSIASSFSGVDEDDIRNFATELPARLFEYLIVFHLEGHYPIFSAVLNLIGLIEYIEVPSDPLNIAKTAYIRKSLRLDRFGDLFSDPASYFSDIYQWGQPGYNGEKLLKNIHNIFLTMGIPIRYQRANIPGESSSLEYLFFSIKPKLDTPAKGLEFLIKPAFNGTFDFQIPFIQNNWFINFSADSNLQGETGVYLLSSGELNIIPPSGTAEGSLGVFFVAQPPVGRNELIIVGQSGGSRISTARIKAGIKTSFDWDSASGNAKGDFGFEAALEQCKIILDASGSDGFIGTLLGDTRVEADFSIVMGVSSSRGFYFQGSSALEVRLPAHIELGPISIEGLTLKMGLEDGQIPVSVGADIKATLGPIVAVVQNMGVTATFSFPDDRSGNLGPVQFDLGFKPPNGVGLSIDTGVIKGGGFLNLDFDKGEYFGALELSFQGVISLKAIGIINTKMPDGSDGFALLILITAEFTPIQLGFGFTLNGVGGLIAVNRSTNLEALRAGVRTGAVSSILFPQDIVANITRIISDLKTIFPIVEGHFILAPMAKIGWGTPTLITLELGIILDIPKPAFVIIGVLRCILPTEEAAILKLQVNFAGGIDFDEGLIWFDATIFDSSILVFSLSGDMALRIGWKNPVFVISVGGFHPAFKEVPSDLRGMRRIMLSLLSGDNPRLNAQLYFAITSNTVQSGARVELYAEACGFNVYGYIGYDLLIQFSPFYFIADISAGIALRMGTDPIAGISIHCQLSGPTPWNANGEATLTILFFDISVGFDVIWGEDAPSQPVETVNVLQLVLDALNDDRNWKADMPANTTQTVTLKKIDTPEDTIIMHPFGVLSASQKIVPLNLEITKFGHQIPTNDKKFNITYSGSSKEIKEEFAIANFIELSDSEKVSRKSFDTLPAGLTFSAGDATVTGNGLQKEVNYEMSYVHKKRTLRFGLFKMFVGVYNILVQGNSVSKSAYAVNKRIATIGPAEINVSNPGYSVVNVSNMELHRSDLSAATEAQAYQMFNEIIAQDPSLRGKVQVVSQYEM